MCPLPLLFQLYESTALHNAAGNGETEICYLLLDKGADLHAKDKVIYADIDTDTYRPCLPSNTSYLHTFIQPASSNIKYNLATYIPFRS